MSLHILFICSRNQWRSPTAENIYARLPSISARSRGTSRKAKKSVTRDDIAWADIVFVMERKHRQRLQADFPHETRHAEIHVLDIPDDYQYMDPELIEEITACVDPILNDRL